MNTVEHFIERVNQDADLQARTEEAGSAEAVVGLTRELGYAFSAEHFRAATETLSEEDLGSVVGGICGIREIR